MSGFRAAAALAACLAACVAAGPAFAADAPDASPYVVATPHEVTLQFSLAPGASKTFSLPIAGWPVLLTAALTPNNGGTQTPTALISAEISLDKSSRGMTWIGTDGNGSQVVGNNLGSSLTIASFAFSNAVLTSKAFGSDKLTITQSTTGTNSNIYRVTMTY